MLISSILWEGQVQYTQLLTSELPVRLNIFNSPQSFLVVSSKACESPVAWQLAARNFFLTSQEFFGKPLISIFSDLKGNI